MEHAEQAPEVKTALGRMRKNPRSKRSQKRKTEANAFGGQHLPPQEYRRRVSYSSEGGKAGKKVDKKRAGQIGTRVQQLKVYRRFDQMDHPRAIELAKELKALGWKGFKDD